MTKDELIAKIAKETDLKETDVAEIIKIFVEQVKEKLDHGETVEIPGFGNFMLSADKKD